MQNILAIVEKVGRLTGAHCDRAAVRATLQKYKLPWRVRFNAHTHMLTDGDLLYIGARALAEKKPLHSKAVINALCRRATRKGRIMCKLD